ncbi:MAG: extracellular solute-binding protein, partial [Saccharofermentanales bacterium]
MELLRKKWINYLCLLTALFCVISVVSGCKPGTPAASGESTVSEAVNVDDLEGRNVRIMGWTGTTLEPVKGATEREDKEYDYLRSLETEYNFKFEFIEVPYYSMMSTYISGVAAGAPPADIIDVSIRSFYPGLVTKNMMIPLSDFEYFDFTDPKWTPLTIKTGSYKDKVYGCDTYRRGGVIVYWNKSLFEREGLPNLYDLQTAGTWTWDKMMEISKKAAKDINADGTFDQFGLGGEFYGQYAAVYSNEAAFVDFTEDKPTFALNSNNGIEALQFIQDLKTEPGVWIPPTGGWDYGFKMFKEGKVAMSPAEYWVAGAYGFDEMEDEYGVVMFPKGPKATDYTSVAADFGLFTIPTSTEKPAQVAFILDKFLTPLDGESADDWKNDYETFFTDEGTEKTFELMMDNRVDFTYLEMFHDSMWPLYLEYMTDIESGAVSPKAQMDAYAQRGQALLNDVFTIANGGQLAGSTDKVKTIQLKSLAWITKEVNVIQEIINKWNVDNPELQVQYVQGFWNNTEAELISGFASGLLPDIFHYTASTVNSWKSTGELEDIKSIFTEADLADFNPDTMKLLTDEEGKIYGIPFEYETELTLYNKRLFAKAGVVAPTFEKPWTYEEFIAAARKLNGVEEGVFGIGVLGYENPLNYFNSSWSTKLTQGLVYKETNGSYSIKVQDKFKNIMTGMQQLITDKVMPETVLTGYSGIAAFKKEKVAMLAGVGSWNRYELAKDSVTVEWG